MGWLVAGGLQTKQGSSRLNDLLGVLCVEHQCRAKRDLPYFVPTNELTSPEDSI